MSSTILYKFRASSEFRFLPLSGSAARLFDVKKAIVKANKLDSGSMDFDLAVRNADTNEEYADESMLLPRGSRIVVQRLPAARGNGFLARMARNEHGGSAGNNNSNFQQQNHPSGFYTIDSRARENEEEEFVETSGNENSTENNDDKELAALQAVTSMQPDGPTMVGGRSMTAGGHRGGRGGPQQPAGMGVPPPSKPNYHYSKANTHHRPNADPELREQEKKLLPKKRATGIPRTFLNLSAPPQTDGTNKEGEESEQTQLLQPNRQGFEELVNRRGGQSERIAGTRRDLDYGLKLTLTIIPEHLQCAICNNVVKNAMLLPWDTEGRTVCDTCVRDALTQNGFRCPLTGMDGVSPDDLIPNVGLRKAADLFIKGVMEKVDEIEKQQVKEIVNTAEDLNAQSSENNLLNGEGVERGVIVSKRMSFSSHKKSDDDRNGGGDDDFGGDVFAVDAKSKTNEEPEKSIKKKDDKIIDTSTTKVVVNTDNKSESNKVESPQKTKSIEPMDIDSTGSNKVVSSSTNEINNTNDKNNDQKDDSISTESSALKLDNEHCSETSTESNKTQKSQTAPTPPMSHMRFHRRRGPPAGYVMGPGGGAISTSARVNQAISTNNYHGSNGQNYPGHVNAHENGFSPRGGRGRGRFFSRGRGGRNSNFHHGGSYGRGRSGRGRGRGRFDGDGRGRGRFDGDQQDHRSIDENDSRGIKRNWDDNRKEQDSDGFRDEDGGGRGSYGRGGYRGGRGGGRSWGGNRGSFRGGRGNYARGRGRY